MVNLTEKNPFGRTDGSRKEEEKPFEGGKLFVPNCCSWCGVRVRNGDNGSTLPPIRSQAPYKHYQWLAAGIVSVAAESAFSASSKFTLTARNVTTKIVKTTLSRANCDAFWRALLNTLQPEEL
ncbi:hypothetical protein TcWFU_005873 [Taenia crassiceps]|uniref:HAT C-terminal dimerisation domain-containing protein n=1 Tax=Taenia crassiceps TaxID=6207 RepID=A0ABR4Q749_9CEST